MFVKNFATNKSSQENGPAIIIANEAMGGEATHYGLCQAKLTGTITVKLQGRLSSSQDWVDLATFTATGLQEVVLLPEMRWAITAVSGGTLNSMDVGFIGG